MKKVAIAQFRSGIEKQKSVDIMIEAIKDASGKDADLLVFGECWLGGYPAWIDVCRDIALWDFKPMREAWAGLFENGFVLKDESHRRIEEACQDYEVDLVFGCNESVKKGAGNQTIYNSIIGIARTGNTVLHHRKLMPTFNEKLIYGRGNNGNLMSVEMAIGRVGGLICWEHWMAMARYKLHLEGEDVHVALWPAMKERHLLASRHYAFEGRCVVLAVGQLYHKDDIPNGLEIHPDRMDVEWLLDGGSTVIGPTGNVIFKCPIEEEGLFLVEVPAREELIPYRMELSAGGHYDRPELWKK